MSKVYKVTIHIAAVLLLSGYTFVFIKIVKMVLNSFPTL